jgi:aspartyl protease family protein
MELALLIVLMALVIHYPRKSGPARINRKSDLDVPRIEVTFNDNQTEEMILDTGASITTITPKMAKNLNVTLLGAGKFTLADGSHVVMPVGKVDSIEVGGAKVENVQVAIGGDALLGQSFFGKHEVIIKQDVVEFR